MSRSKNYRYLLRAPLAVLPFFIACGSSATRPPASASGDTESAEAGSKNDMPDDSDAKEKNSESSKADADKAGAADGKAADKNADADDDDKPPVDDSRTTASIAAVIKENRKAFKKCYEDAHKEQPELKGNVLLKIVLDGAGKVKKAYVDDESSIRTPKVVDCMIKLAQSLSYPKSSKGLDKDFEYDFGFNNQTK